MSWLFGYRSSQPRDFTQFVPPSPPSDGGGGAGGSGGSPPRIGAQMEAYRFDSSALERAAAAAKELERSKYAKEALDLAMAQEAAKKMEFQNEMKKYEASIEQQKTERIRLEAEQRMKAAQEETKQHQMRAQYQDQLARKRYEEQLILQQKMNDENLRRQEESLAKQEAIKKATMEHKMELKHKNEMKKLEVELNTKAKIDRDNLDISLEKIRTKASEERTTALEKIKTTGSLIGLGAKEFLGDWNKILTSASYLSLVAFGLYSAKASTSVASRYIAARLGKPSLLRETSRVVFLDVIRHPIEAIKKLKKTKQTDTLSGVILAPKLEEKLRDIAIATKNTKKNRGNYRNILMYGPPGTGKTMFTKKLAEHSGMDYAIMTGGDVVPLGEDGVTAIHRVFDWASTSRKGLLLFIDEADAFVQKRSTEQMSGNLRAMLNAFLYRIGESNNKFMLVLATNTPEQFDRAINDRLDEMIEFSLPGREERERLVRLYFDKYILQPAIEGNKRLKIAEFDYSSLCSKVADLTDGISGRQLEKLALTWQTAAYTSDDGVLTEKMIMDKCLEAIKQNKQKVHWESKQEKQESKSIYATKDSIRRLRRSSRRKYDSSSLDNCKSAFVNNL